MSNISNLYQVTRDSIKRNTRCGCNSPLSSPLGSGEIRLCSYHEGMEDGIDIDRQHVQQFIEAVYGESLIEKDIRDIIIKELGNNA